MNFLVRSYLQKHRQQYLAASLAILISSMFMAAAACFGNALIYALSFEQHIMSEGSDLILANQSFERFKDAELNIENAAYYRELSKSILTDKTIEAAKRDMLGQYFRELADYFQAEDSEKKNIKAPNMPENEDKALDKYFSDNYLFKQQQKAILKAVSNIKTISPYYYSKYCLITAGKYKMHASFNYILEQADFYRPTLLAGTYPKQASDVILTTDSMKELKAELGDKVSVKVSDKELECTIVGVVAQDFYHRTPKAPKFYVAPSFAIDKSQNVQAYRILLKDKQAESQTLSELKQYVEKHCLLPSGWTLLNKATYLKYRLESGNSFKLGLHLSIAIFPILTLLVCFTIVSSTFTVILARRRREQGLLRCIGATSKQLVRYSLLECLIVGFLSSSLGVLLAYILTFGLSVKFNVLASYAVAWQVLGPWPAILTVLAVTLITVLAGLRPSVESSKISPISALQGLNYEKRKHTLRLIIRLLFGIICLIAASACFGLAFYLHLHEKTDAVNAAYAMPALVLGATLYLATILALGKFFLAKIAAICLKPWQKASIVVRMSINNLLRNKERNSATMSTLVLGVIMILTTLIGAASLEASVYTGVKAKMPIDLAVMADSFADTIETEFSENLSNLPGVEKVVKWPAFKAPTSIQIEGETKDLMEEIDKKSAYILARPYELADINLANLYALKEDEILLPKYSELNQHGKVNLAGKTLCLNYGDQHYKLKAKVIIDADRQVSLPFATIGIVHPKFAAKLEKSGLSRQIAMLFGQLQTNKVFLQQELVAEIQRLTNRDTMQLAGNVFFLALVTQILQVIKLILVSLITIVAVVSLIGVANTLNLSVLERRHETALLRAIGFTKEQVKRMLLVEGLSLGIVSLVLGAFIAFAFAIFGLHVLPLGEIVAKESYRIVIPWLECGAFSLFVITLVYIATLIPSKLASRASVIADLASSQE
ncbi:FtsX-like permease family protein [Amygdalobacter nucleatus]|uniref:Efflux ABC transporter, permease protein n=1 Tax=Amygdalobacter nucleatus TaxID=3029274 RepID=A0A133Y7H4_9FIRM|nr:FtsX-like permease family protein [Amygdalobacter nucleatus]KXB39148.1 efflux ABC transporter, permease protein [Amygdalobacter nucleatus]MDF0485519.1 FtsX-like permease family protein [Amygdalobacter nucleatus]